MANALLNSVVPAGFELVAGEPSVKDSALLAQLKQKSHRELRALLADQRRAVTAARDAVKDAMAVQSETLQAIVDAGLLPVEEVEQVKLTDTAQLREAAFTTAQKLQELTGVEGLYSDAVKPTGEVKVEDAHNGIVAVTATAAGLKKAFGAKIANALMAKGQVEVVKEQRIAKK